MKHIKKMYLSEMMRNVIKGHFHASKLASSGLFVKIIHNKVAY